MATDGELFLAHKLLVYREFDALTKLRTASKNVNVWLNTKAAKDLSDAQLESCGLAVIHKKSLFFDQSIIQRVLQPNTSLKPISKYDIMDLCMLLDTDHTSDDQSWFSWMFTPEKINEDSPIYNAQIIKALIRSIAIMNESGELVRPTALQQVSRISNVQKLAVMLKKALKSSLHEIYRDVEITEKYVQNRLQTLGVDPSKKYKFAVQKDGTTVVEYAPIHPSRIEDLRNQEKKSLWQSAIIFYNCTGGVPN